MAGGELGTPSRAARVGTAAELFARRTEFMVDTELLAGNIGAYALIFRSGRRSRAAQQAQPQRNGNEGPHGQSTRPAGRRDAVRAPSAGSSAAFPGNGDAETFRFS